MTRRTTYLVLSALLVSGLLIAPRSARADEEVAMADGGLSLTSSAFSPGERIPQVHAYAPEGKNLSPPLAWSGVPDGTRELALIVDDPDAPRADPWVHWVVYAIPADATEIPSGAREGKNDFGERSWGGPLPPKGHGTHHYHFKLYALDAPLGLGDGATKADVLHAMAGHVLAEAELVGTYSR